jgi:hypothetical protein
VAGRAAAPSAWWPESRTRTPARCARRHRRAAEARQVRRQAPEVGLEIGDDRVPEVGCVGIAVQEEDRRTSPLIADEDRGAESRDPSYAATSVPPFTAGSQSFSVYAPGVLNSSRPPP